MVGFSDSKVTAEFDQQKVIIIADERSYRNCIVSVSWRWLWLHKMVQDSARMAPRRPQGRRKMAKKAQDRFTFPSQRAKATPSGSRL